MNSVAEPASREPTSQDGTSFVSASIAAHVQTSPKPKVALLLGRDVLRLGVAERPDLVDLERACRAGSAGRSSW